MKSQEQKEFERIASHSPAVTPSVDQVVRWTSGRKQTKCAAAFMVVREAWRVGR